MCASARCTLASLGYPLEPVQETNKLHFNGRNINFPQDGKLIIAAEPQHLTPVKRRRVSLLRCKIGRCDSKWSMREGDRRCDLSARCQRPSKGLLSRTVTGWVSVTLFLKYRIRKFLRSLGVFFGVFSKFQLSQRNGNSCRTLSMFYNCQVVRYQGDDLCCLSFVTSLAHTFYFSHVLVPMSLSSNKTRVVCYLPQQLDGNALI